MIPENFETKALNLFAFQFQNNDLYKKYCQFFNKNVNTVSNIEDIPFLPISFFKTHEIKSTCFKEEIVFFSSATTQKQVSKHFVRDVCLYQRSFEDSFNFFYGPFENYCFLFLLPSYLERKNSSLVFMASSFVKKSKFKESGFFLNDFEKLARQITYNISNNIPSILFGVSFALLDFAEQYEIDLSKIIVIETGGMKGRREEISRKAIHDFFYKKFKCENVHSEYGMTELMSQSYSKGKGIFSCPPSIRILIRNVNDPLETTLYGRGGLNIIDLNNKYSCSFIASDDYGCVYEDQRFELLGRILNSEVRGCNQLVV